MSHPDTNPKTCENASDDFHVRLDCAIRAAGMLPFQVAFIVGVNPSTLSRWLAGSSQPKARHIAALVRTTGCSAEWLVLGDGDGPVSVEVGS